MPNNLNVTIRDIIFVCLFVGIRHLMRRNPTIGAIKFHCKLEDEFFMHLAHDLNTHLVSNISKHV